jgi:mannose-6-phosphate isomerase-like protein (cupin superfamily)
MAAAGTCTDEHRSSPARLGPFSGRLLASPCVTDVYVGNVGPDAATDRGWLLGHFKPAGDLRHSDEVEIKWGVHPPGDRRAAWATGERRTALLVLISGRFRVELRDRSVLLSKQGDYIVWGPGVDHSWYAEEESIVLTVRWPSIPGYRVPDGEG